MHFSKVAIGTVAALVATAAVAAATIPSRMTANQPHGFRGDTTTYRVQLTANGVPCANQLVYFYDCSDARPFWEYKSCVSTDAEGYARLTYRIPRSVWEDNVHLLGEFYGNSSVKGSRVDTRVQIGR